MMLPSHSEILSLTNIQILDMFTEHISWLSTHVQPPSVTITLYEELFLKFMAFVYGNPHAEINIATRLEELSVMGKRLNDAMCLLVNHLDLRVQMKRILEDI